MNAVLGAVVAGGRSRRYGSPKAMAEVGGRRIVQRVVDALCAVTPEAVVISADPLVIAAAGLPARPDVLPDMGALGGIHAALLRAREHRHHGVLAVACDMPFLSVPLLRRLVERACESDLPDAVLPESGGRRGLEPLCAFYAVSCIAPIEAAARRDDRRMIAFHDDVVVRTLPIDEVLRYGEPDLLFLNVNTPDEREVAERIAAGRPV